MCMRIPVIKRKRLLQQVLRPPLFVRAHPPNMRKRPYHEIGRVNVLQRFASQTRGFGENDLGLHRVNESACDVVLPLETLNGRAIETVRPDVHAPGGVYQLCADANSAAGVAQAALEHVAHTQLARDLAEVDRITSECKTGVAGDN